MKALFVSAVRRVPPRFSIPPISQEVKPGGSINLTCVAVGAPMPYVRWVSGEAELTQEDKMPVGRNVLELTNIHQSANYTCVATSSLGTIETTAQVFVKGQGVLGTYRNVEKKSQSQLHFHVAVSDSPSH